MFSFILRFQGFFEKFRKQKSLFFTTLLVGSLLAVAGCIYYISGTVERTAYAAYSSSKESLSASLDNMLVGRSEKLLAIATMASNDHNLVTALKSGNTDLLNDTADKLSKFSTSPIALLGYSRNQIFNVNAEAKSDVPSSVLKVASEMNPMIGLEKVGDTVYLTAIVPVASDSNSTEGVIEVRQDVGFMYDAIKDEGKNFVLLLDRAAYQPSDLRIKSAIEINERYVTIQKQTDPDLIDELKAVPFEKLSTEGYVIGHRFFVMAKQVKGAEGNPIGLIIVGDDMEKKSNIVHVAKKTAKGLTLAAIGLSIALLLVAI